MSEAFGKWWNLRGTDFAPRGVHGAPKSAAIAAWQACKKDCAEEIRQLGLENAGLAGRNAAAELELYLLRGCLDIYEGSGATDLAKALDLIAQASKLIQGAKGIRTMYHLQMGE